MEKWINLVEVSCADPDREDEFNEWYNKIHLPDVLKTPGFISARRYEAKEYRDGRGKYLAIYEIETDDIDKTMALRLEIREKEASVGRSHGQSIPNLLMHYWKDVLYKEIIEKKR